ncbi:uncharacterized protein LOC143033809 [Oratosquilla oratoria]|uniref:uncharacterized protein LOC143033809 n=1 Tax=Oratosquilla oratoria TaxID=337810 RepID=UPI003F75A6AC
MSNHKYLMVGIRRIVQGEVLLLLLLLTLGGSLADWESECPDTCKCTYVSNRKVVDCSQVQGQGRSRYSTVPTTLNPEIQELKLEYNAIQILQKDAFKEANLVNLQKLSLKGNLIREVNQDAFRDLRILIELDLSYNRISKLHPKTFTGMEKLRKLYLGNNPIVRLEGLQFPVLPHLDTISLRDCHINYIHNYAFSNLHHVKSIRISNNKLSRLQSELFTNNTQLKELELQGNMWNCDCRLKNFVHWVLNKNYVKRNTLKCTEPERLSGRQWETVELKDLACKPVLEVPRAVVAARLDTNTSLACHVSGDPLPSVKWVLNGRVLTNMSVIPYSQPEQTYMLHNTIEGLTHWSYLTITHLTEHDLTDYTCVGENTAGLVERNVSLVLDSPVLFPSTPHTPLDLYVIIAIVTAAILLLLLIIVLICCCWRRRKRRRAEDKSRLNGSAGGHVEHKNIMIVNPVEKPPRNYEKVPQNDIELTNLSGQSEAGAHRNYDELNYPEGAPEGQGAGPAVAPMEEEEDMTVTLDTTLPIDGAMSVSASYPSHEYPPAHYPDLLDHRVPRTVSPTSLSYQSLNRAVPHFQQLAYGEPVPAEYRYSYVHPAEFSQQPHYPAPQHPRPGYVTLPRRPRTPSWGGSSSTTSAKPSTSVKFDPIYDTVGPRTSADGTSRTDLTRRVLVDPYSPRTPISSPQALPLHYTSIQEEGHYPHHTPYHHTSTLPRSTPNLLDGGLSLPMTYHQTSTPIQPPITSQPVAPVMVNAPTHSPTPSTASTARTASPAHVHPSAFRKFPPTKKSSKSSSPSLNGDNYTPNSPSALNTSNDSALSDSASNNNNYKTSLNSKNNSSFDAGGSEGSSKGRHHGSGGSSSPPPVVISTTPKKVPPKPPPKPNVKRLSVSSTLSDSGRKTSIGEGGVLYQDEGPDGTEV